MLVLQVWRSWRNDKAVAFLAVAAFAAGIGAATAIYTVVNAVMLKPLPYRDGERFVAIFSAATNDPEHYGSLSFTDAQTYQERTRVFDASRPDSNERCAGCSRLDDGSGLDLRLILSGRFCDSPNQLRRTLGQFIPSSCNAPLKLPIASGCVLPAFRSITYIDRYSAYF
jgi:hypothetical protein